MLRDERGLEALRHVHFANGFPPKGLVAGAPRIVPNSHSANMHGGYFVGLQDRVGCPPSMSLRPHRSIPPLAKGRGQFCAVKRRRQDDVHFRINPFKAKKGTEKVGFSPQPIKHAHSRFTRSAHQMESRQIPPVPPSVLKDVRVLRKKPLHVVAAHPNLVRNTFDNKGSDHVIAASGSVKNVKILSDVEKVTTQAELTGIEEVYKRICHGNIETLSTLVSTKAQGKKKSGLQFIQTTAPLNLGKQLAAKRQRAKEDSVFDSAAIMRSRSLDDAKELRNQALDDNHEQLVESIQSKYRSILVPLPYFKSGSDGTVSTVGRQGKPVYEPPIVYGSKKQISTLNSTSMQSASVVNISAAGLPEGRPGTRNCNCSPTGQIVGVQNRSSTGTVAIVAAIPQMRTTPPQTPNTWQTSAGTFDTESASGFFEKYKSQDFEINANGEDDNIEAGNMEIESVDDVVSEGSCSGKSMNGKNEKKEYDVVTGIEILEDKKSADQDMMAQPQDKLLLSSDPEAEDVEGKKNDMHETEENTGNYLDGANTSTPFGVQEGSDTAELTMTMKLRKMSLGITLNVTTEDGKREGVEMYDATLSDQEKQEVSSKLEAIAEAKERRKKEVENLLNEVSEIEKQIMESQSS